MIDAAVLTLPLLLTCTGRWGRANCVLTATLNARRIYQHADCFCFKTFFSYDCVFFSAFNVIRANKCLSASKQCVKNIYVCFCLLLYCCARLNRCTVGEIHKNLILNTEKCIFLFRKLCKINTLKVCITGF